MPAWGAAAAVVQRLLVRRRAAVLCCLAFAGALANAVPAHAQQDAQCRRLWSDVSGRPVSDAFLRGTRAPGVVADEAPTIVATRTEALVVEVRAQPGDWVRAGQPLVVLSSEHLERDRALLDADAQSAQQDIVRLQERARSVAANLQRHRNYPDLFSKSEIESIEADLVAANAEARQAQIRLQQIAIRRAGFSADRSALTLVAPLDGVVRRVGVQPGMRVQVGTAVAEIASGRQRRLRFAVPAANAPDYDAGRAVCVVWPSRQWFARVSLADVRRRAMDAGDTIAVDAAPAATAAWPVGIAVDVLPLPAQGAAR